MPESPFMRQPLTPKAHDFEISLRLGRLGRHRVTLAAPDATEAKRKATHDAVATSGGEFANWSILNCDKLAACTARRAA